MPEYYYSHPATEEVVSIVQSMHDIHEYTDENGTKWNRLWTKPLASIDSKIDPNNSREFVEKTRNKKGTIGDLFDQSKELSQQRENKYGYDGVKNNFYNDYSKLRRNKKHPNQIRESSGDIVI